MVAAQVRIRMARTWWLDFLQTVFAFVNGRSNKVWDLLMTWQVLKFWIGLRSHWKDAIRLQMGGHIAIDDKFLETSSLRFQPFAGDCIDYVLAFGGSE